MYFVTFKFDINPHYMSDFKVREIKQENNSLKNEIGCINFDVCFSQNHLTKKFLYEIYKNKNAYTEHLKSLHYIDFIKQVSPWVNNKIINQYKKK